MQKILFTLTIAFAMSAQNAGEPQTDSFYRGGIFFQSVKFNGIETTAVLFSNKQYFRVDLSIVNGSDHRIEVDPSAFRFDITAPKPHGAEYVSAESLEKKRRREALWADALTSAQQGLAGHPPPTSTATVDDNRGNRVANVSVYDKTQPTTREQIQARAAQDIAQINAASLHRETLDPGMRVAGSILFKMDAHATEMKLTTPGGAFSWAKK